MNSSPPLAPPPTYHVIDGPTQHSCLSRRQITERLRTGQLSQNTLIRAEGSEQWIVATAFQAGTESSESGAPPYATIGDRVKACLADALVIFIPVTIVYNLTSFGSVTLMNAHPVLRLIGFVFSTGGFLLSIYGYQIALLASPKQATLGMIYMGLRLQQNNGQPVTIWVSAIRTLVASLISGFCFIGFLWVYWDERKRTLHDVLAGTQVIRIR